jgi:putative hydrolase of the HAD superfamily
VLNLDPQKTYKAFGELANLTLQEVIACGEHDVFKQYEMGSISSNDFRTGVREIFKLNVSDEEFDEAWNAMLLDLPIKRLTMLGALQKKHKTYILSNTNEIHIAAFDAIVKESTNGNAIDNYFGTVYYSHKVGMRKPNANIFEMVINNNGLDSSKTLFIDDTLEHIESAAKLGLSTWHLTNQEELFTIFGNE